VAADGIDASKDGTDWMADEVAVLVGSYFLMLAEERAGRDYNKSEYRRSVIRGRLSESCRTYPPSWTRSGCRGSRATSRFRTTRTRSSPSSSSSYFSDRKCVWMPSASTNPTDRATVGSDDADNSWTRYLLIRSALSARAA